MEDYQEVNEINLIDLMFYCLKKWRWILVGMVLLAVVAGVYKYQATIGDNQEKKALQLQRELTEPAEGEEAVEEEPIVFEDPTSSAVTFAVIGMIGGACLVCLIFCMSYVMSGKVQDVSNFRQRFGMPLLGVIRRSETKKKVFGFVDRWICRLEEGPCAKIPRKEQIKIAVVNVQAAIHRNSGERSGEKISRVMLAGTIAGEDVTEICEELAEEVRDVTFSPYRQIVFHAAALRKVEHYEGIVFIEKKGESYEKIIRQEKELAEDRGVKVLGTVVC